jgi:hypothetical protein
VGLWQQSFNGRRNTYHLPDKEEEGGQGSD